MLIAAGGYIITIFDPNIDRINKPEKLVVEKVIKRRGRLWALDLIIAGVILGFYKVENGRFLDRLAKSVVWRCYGL